MKKIFKMVSLLMAAAALFSCDGTLNSDGEFKVTVDKNVIQNYGGDYATFTVTLGGEAVTDGVIFHDAKDNVVDMPDFKFSSETTGKYQFWVEYGVHQSETIEISVVSVEIPKTVADPKPSSTDFKARMLVTEVTATGCPPCPGMKNILHPALEDKGIADKVVFTTCHNLTINDVADPAYIYTDYAKFNPPYLYCDMYDGTGYFEVWTVNNIINELNKFYGDKEKGAAGIAVNSSLKDGQLVFKATVKAAETANYRIGAFLLEDGVYADYRSANAEDWMDTSDGVIRYIDSEFSQGGKTYFAGHSVGKVEAGKTADYVFAWDLNQIWEDGSTRSKRNAKAEWAERVEANLHLAVFVSTIKEDKKGNQYYYVSNVIDCPVNGETPFEYR